MVTISFKDMQNVNPEAPRSQSEKNEHKVVLAIILDLSQSEHQLNKFAIVCNLLCTKTK